MRAAVEANATKVSDVATRGYATFGPGFVWLQFMFKSEWLLRIEFMPMDTVRQLGMRKDTMDNIESIASGCDPLTQAAMLVFKGDDLQSMGLMPLVGIDGP
jgi:hypothetical protein